MGTELREHERLDDLQNGFEIIQDSEKFCFGMDAVLLSGYAQVRPGEMVLDFCTGTGIVPILLRAKTYGKHFTGMEIQEECVDMARRSVVHNHLESEITIEQGDVKEASAIFGRASFDVVTCNPPYMIHSHGFENSHMPKAIARHEILCTLEDVVREASRVLRQKGRFYLVHRPFRLAEIMGILLKYKLEPKRMRLVYPFVDKEPNMVLLEAVVGGKSRIQVEKPLIIYEKTGVYTQEVLEIYQSRRK